MCDSNLIIRHIDAAFAGCLNDPYIFKHSALRRKLKEYFEADPSFWVLGKTGCAVTVILSLNSNWQMLTLFIRWQHICPWTMDADTNLRCWRGLCWRFLHNMALQGQMLCRKMYWCAEGAFPLPAESQGSVLSPFESRTDHQSMCPPSQCLSDCMLIRLGMLLGEWKVSSCKY